MDYNKTHPEKTDDEVFLSNVLGEDFEAIGWKTKRKGNDARNPYGQPITGKEGPFFPVFVKRKEVEKQIQELESKVEIFKKLLL